MLVRVGITSATTASADDHRHQRAKAIIGRPATAHQDDEPYQRERDQR